MRINDILKLGESKGASDIHLTVGLPPILRVDGELVITDLESLTKENSRALIYSMLNDERKASFEKNRELDFSFTLKGMDRYRINVHYQRGNVEAALRRVPKKIPSIESLGLPEIVFDLIKKPNGLILVTGPTGTGKSTSLAAMVNYINKHRKELIVSIEDPIEFVYKNEKSIVKQREVFSDTHSFPEALKRGLRQDPDVIVVGEMRDLETIATALTAAETGHLVLATLHTPDAPQTIQRIIDVFPPHQQRQVTVQLAECLQAVISQVLLRRAESKGRVLATEVMVSTPGVRNLIRENDVAQLPSLIQMGGQHGMYTMDKCLKSFFKKGIITKEAALRKVKNLAEFNSL
ncbi:MAG: type IV pilus twitching motility protein PilT [Candidatus Omnitrophica bacterium]|nr:type IV pilus twitching motility protein PilT [Candidatus Omnitrophota bacterium]MCF7877578.1 type IV pilus twitching motility protein PilT [Candidatus Omnitrophota bacterium]MCF7878004.1 type IV pilus twitching motility protein PilT [Candidatus Omnitrophota bacterium]